MGDTLDIEKASELSEELLKNYYDLSVTKKQIEQEMSQFKKMLHHHFDQTAGAENKAEVQRGKYKAQRIIRSTVNYDEELTVQKLEELHLNDFIIHVKHPDTEKLEAAIKIDLVKEEEFLDCKIKKVSQAITVKEVNE